MKYWTSCYACRRDEGFVWSGFFFNTARICCSYNNQYSQHLVMLLKLSCGKDYYFDFGKSVWLWHFLQARFFYYFYFGQVFFSLMTDIFVSPCTSTLLSSKAANNDVEQRERERERHQKRERGGGGRGDWSSQRRRRMGKWACKSSLRAFLFFSFFLRVILWERTEPLSFPEQWQKGSWVGHYRLCFHSPSLPPLSLLVHSSSWHDYVCTERVCKREEEEEEEEEEEGVGSGRERLLLLPYCFLGTARVCQMVRVLYCTYYYIHVRWHEIKITHLTISAVKKHACQNFPPRTTTYVSFLLSKRDFATSGSPVFPCWCESPSSSSSSSSSSFVSRLMATTATITPPPPNHHHHHPDPLSSIYPLGSHTPGISGTECLKKKEGRVCVLLLDYWTEMPVSF